MEWYSCDNVLEVTSKLPINTPEKMKGFEERTQVVEDSRIMFG